jgi:uncharacterized membrane protein required for colicin V production
MHPSSNFKVAWDLFIVALSIWNSWMIPFDYAYTPNTPIWFTIFERVIDVVFILDILLNFRTLYYDFYKNKYVNDWRIIAFRYVFQGRFIFDLMASVPVEALMLISENLRFLGMFKIIRLLRLSRLLHYLRSYQNIKFILMIMQQCFVLFLGIHFINCFWYSVTKSSGKWIPAKDLDAEGTNAFSDSNYDNYLLNLYYGVLTLLTNDLIPTSTTELNIAILFIFVGVVIVGVLIGEFSDLLDKMTRKG